MSGFIGIHVCEKVITNKTGQAVLWRGLDKLMIRSLIEMIYNTEENPHYEQHGGK